MAPGCLEASSPGTWVTSSPGCPWIAGLFESAVVESNREVAAALDCLQRSIPGRISFPSHPRFAELASKSLNRRHRRLDRDLSLHAPVPQVVSTSAPDPGLCERCELYWFRLPSRTGTPDIVPRNPSHSRTSPHQFGTSWQGQTSHRVPAACLRRASVFVGPIDGDLG